MKIKLIFFTLVSVLIALPYKFIFASQQETDPYIIAQAEEQVAKVKKNCEDPMIKTGSTPKEAEDSCKDLVDSTRGLLETKSPAEEKFEDPNVSQSEKMAIMQKTQAFTEETKNEIEASKNRMFDYAVELIDTLYAQGKINQKQSGLLDKVLHDSNLSEDNKEDFINSILSLNRLWLLGGDDKEYIAGLISKAENLKK